MAVDAKKLKAFAKGQDKGGGGGGPKAKPFGGKKKGGDEVATPEEPDDEEDLDDEDDEDGGSDEEIAARVGAQVKAGKTDQDLMDRMDGFDESGGAPSWVDDVDIWDRAKAAVEPSWGEYDDPFVVVAHVYKELGGAVSSAD